MGKYLIGALVVVAIIVIIALLSHKGKQTEKDSSSVPVDIRSRDYRKTVYQNTPHEYQLELGNLFDCLDELDAEVQRNASRLSSQASQTASEVLRKAEQAEKQLSAHWASRKKQADFYYYIGLHYTSFTLADSLTRELDALRQTRKDLTELINATQAQIDPLKQQIDASGRHASVQLKSRHKELCQKCDALRKTRKVCNQQIAFIKKRRDDQNHITGKRRDYIGSHFGKRGKLWRSRIMAKHHKNTIDE